MTLVASKSALQWLVPRRAGTELRILLALLAALTIGIAGTAAFGAWRQFADSHRIAARDAGAALLLRAAERVQLERGLVQGALLAPAPAARTVLDPVAAHRQASAALLRDAFDRLTALVEAEDGP